MMRALIIQSDTSATPECVQITCTLPAKVATIASTAIGCWVVHVCSLLSTSFGCFQCTLMSCTKSMCSSGRCACWRAIADEDRPEEVALKHDRY